MINFIDPKIVRRVNREFREKDTNNNFNGHGFNVTERAIRHLRRVDLCCNSGLELEYRLALENEISNIVNDNKNLPCMTYSYWK